MSIEMNNCCSSEPVTIGKIECQPNPFKPTDEQIKRYQAEYNYINRFKLMVNSVSDYLESKAFITKKTLYISAKGFQFKVLIMGLFFSLASLPHS